MKLSQVLSRDQNNFDLVRFLAASAVIVGHAYALTPVSGQQDLVQQLVHFEYSGSVAVEVFFFLSGLLVCNSLMRSQDLLKFVTARVLRIMPGLIACVFLTAFVVGPVFTTLGLREYLTSQGVLGYFYSNVSLALAWPLPGVFESHRVIAMNGSLWTLPWEAFMYLGVLVLGASGVLYARRSLAAFVIGSILIGYISLAHVQVNVDHEIIVPMILFVAGGLAAAFADWITISPVYLIVLLLITALSHHYQAVFRPLFYVSLAYGMLWFASNRFVRKLHLPGDYSYGIYIYGFLVQQCLVELFSGRGPLFNMVVSLPIAIIAGMLSWHLLEKRALQAVPDVTSALRDLVSRRPGRLQALSRSPVIVICLAMLLLPLTVLGLPTGVTPVDQSFKVVYWGPTGTQAGAGFNVQPDGMSALWIHLNEQVHADAQVRFGGRILSQTAVRGDLITAVVPAAMYAKPGSISVQVEEIRSGHLMASLPVQFIVQ